MLVAAPSNNMSWVLYLLACKNGHYYAGITNDLEALFAAHLAGKGARYTRIRPPIKLLAVIEFNDRASAASSEYTIKQWTSAKKRQFANEHAIQ